MATWVVLATVVEVITGAVIQEKRNHLQMIIILCIESLHESRHAEFTKSVAKVSMHLGT